MDSEVSIEYGGREELDMKELGRNKKIMTETVYLGTTAHDMVRENSNQSNPNKVVVPSLLRK